MRAFYACAILVLLLCLRGSLAQTGTTTPTAHLTPVPIQQVKVDDSFWSPKMKLWRDVTLPDCWDKFENDRGGALNNFDRVRDGQTGGHAGPPWYDGLVYEMIRASADFLAANPDPALENRLDGYIARIAAAQDKDPNGYLNTWTELMAPNQRWGLNGGNDGYQHEMYNIGALCDAAVHYYQATGKINLLKVAVKEANYACDSIGPAPKYELIPNHAMAEESFANLYLFFQQHPELKQQMPVAVDERRYLAEAQYWIEMRGHPRKDQPSYGAYNQDQSPVFEQTAIEGHAVRAALMCAGLTQLAEINGRDDYREAALRLWGDMANKKMYLTGGIGASANGEAFGGDYFLPNDGYLETCAAVGSGFFARNLNLLTGDARYADVLERELYNGALTGVSLAGNSYTYVNPLQADNGNSRWSWNGCPCCPPMFLKLMSAMPGYIYAQDDSGIYVNLFVGSQATIQLPRQKVVLKQTTDYPWHGDVKITVSPAHSGDFAINLRVPGWCEGATSPDDLYQPDHRPVTGAFHVKVNGELVVPEIVNGYAHLRRQWKSGDIVQLTMDMPVQQVKANPKVNADQGRVALMRGPVVYCFEGADNGSDSRNLVIPAQTEFTPEYRRDLLGGVMILTGNATALYKGGGGEPMPWPAKVTAIPYYANANRGTCPMQVWMPESQDVASSDHQQ
jgi:DUF1680 family protein